MLSVAVGMKTCASASQPSRSSRCGQSVGTEMKLPRWPQLMLRQSWLTMLVRALEPAAAGRVGVHDAAGDRLGPASGRPVTST